VSEGEEQDLRDILEHGVLIAWERGEIERILSTGYATKEWMEADKIQKILSNHPYALEKARKQRA